MSVIIYIVGLVAFAIVAEAICSVINFSWDSLIYRILSYIGRHIILVLGSLIFAGWLVITYYFMSRPYRYLEEVVTATETLVSPSDEAIVLSNEMAETENELNRVREKAFNNARAAKEAEKRKNDLVVYLAHDLKTPLTSVIGYLTLLRDEGQISEELRRKYLSISLDKAEHLEDLINEFFEITRFNLSDITLEYSRVNLTRMLEQLTYEFRPMFSDKGLTCSLMIEPDTMISCDVGKMQRVFDNLLRNAVNYSFEGSRIDIRAMQKDGRISILFRNCGNTIPQDKLERIFEQFFRLDSARSSRSGGSGLGLAIAKEIVERHYGTISARSENEVIEFEVMIPVSKIK